MNTDTEGWRYIYLLQEYGSVAKETPQYLSNCWGSLGK